MIVSHSISFILIGKSFKQPTFNKGVMSGKNFKAILSVVYPIGMVYPVGMTKDVKDF